MDPATEALDSVARDDRALQRLAWARAATGDHRIDLQRASHDAGFRSYWRTLGETPARIVMDSPPDREDVRPWLRVRALLESGGVRVPRVLAEDAEAGFLLLEDLGADTYLHVLHAHNAAALFDAAVGQLLKLQAIPVPDAFPAYDEAMLARELRLFDEWFLGHHLALVLDVDDIARLELAYRHLVDAALAQPQVLVHRDFMPRNLMPLDGRPLDGRPLDDRPVDDRPVDARPLDARPLDGSAEDNGPAVLDFQDAVRGPIAYDPVCLFKDAFVSWPEADVAAWLARYHARAAEAGLPVPPLERFLRDADWIGIQRHLKVIGIFARLHHRDAKPKYLQDVPRFFAYLDAVLPKYPELAPLSELIELRVKPAIAQYGNWTEGTADEPA